VAGLYSPNKGKSQKSGSSGEKEILEWGIQRFSDRNLDFLVQVNVRLNLKQHIAIGR
jgi:hypothetical protein